MKYLIEPFIPGIELSERFYKEVVKEKLETNYCDLQYAAALLGRGSEVLGYDDNMSTDHHWGPRFQLFLKDDDFKKFSKDIKEFLSKTLPTSFLGYSTHWSEPDPNDSMNQFLEEKDIPPINHRIEIYSVKSYLRENLYISTLEFSDLEWFCIPEQILLEFTSGKVFYDSYGELAQAREALSYYPYSIWLFKILAQLDRISQEMAFIGRTGGIGDELGSIIETNRLVKFVMEMAFILEKKYIPYPKWFGKAFDDLPIAKTLKPILTAVLYEKDWRLREKIFCDAYLELIQKINSLQIISNMNIKPQNFFNRPQMVVHFDSIISELKKRLKSKFKDLRYPIGTINQFIDNCNILSDAEFSKNVKLFYQAEFKQFQIETREIEKSDIQWIRDLCKEKWYSLEIFSQGKIHKIDTLSGFITLINGNRAGLLTYQINNGECEILTINSLREGIGIGSELLRVVENHCIDSKCHLVWLITTNDNIQALRFFQKRGYSLYALYPNAVDESRQQKPQIPKIGLDGIPIKDEIKLIKELKNNNSI